MIWELQMENSLALIVWVRVADRSGKADVAESQVSG